MNFRGHATMISTIFWKNLLTDYSVVNVHFFQVIQKSFPRTTRTTNKPFLRLRVKSVPKVQNNKLFDDISKTSNLRVKMYKKDSPQFGKNIWGH